MQEDAAPVQTEVHVLTLTELGEQTVKVSSDPCAVAKKGGDVDGYCQPGLSTACPNCRSELPRPVNSRNYPRRPKAEERRVDSTPDRIEYRLNAAPQRPGHQLQASLVGDHAAHRVGRRLHGFAWRRLRLVRQLS
jgi:hypothetical protein